MITRTTSASVLARLTIITSIASVAMAIAGPATGLAQSGETPEKPLVQGTFPKVTWAGPVRAVYGHLRAGRFGEADAELAKLAAAGRLEEDFLTGIEVVLGLLPEIPTVHLYLDRWVEARPESVFARTVRGKWSIKRAWAARGSGWASGVKEEGWRLFSDHLALARKDLEKAHELDPTRPEPCAALITVAMGQGVNSTPAFEQAIAADPRHVDAYRRQATYLMPKWHGSREKLLAFAEKHASSDEEPALALLLYDAHAELARRSDNAGAYFAADERKLFTVVTAGFDRAAAAYPRASAVNGAAYGLARLFGREAMESVARTTCGSTPENATEYALQVFKGEIRGQGPRHAAELLRVAAEADLPQAVSAYPQILASDVNGAPDVKAAFDWSLRAAELDDPLACFLVGRCYIEMKEVVGELDPEKGMEFLVRSSHGGFEPAQLTLARLLVKEGRFADAAPWRGLITERDPSHWTSWFRDCIAGGLDTRPAIEAARRHLASLGGEESPKGLDQAISMHLAADDRAAALSSLERFCEPESSSPWEGLFFALLAREDDALKKRLARIRDRRGKHRNERTGDQLTYLTDLAEVFLAAVESGDPLDQSRIEALEAKRDEGERCNIRYFCGLFQEQRGELDRAREIYEEICATPRLTKFSWILAFVAVRRLDETSKGSDRSEREPR